jgi:hypothetical protein
VIPQRANARVAPRLWLHTVLCFALAVLFHANTPLIWLCVGGYVLVYVLRYRTLARFGRTRRRQWVVALEAENGEVKQSKAS